MIAMLRRFPTTEPSDTNEILSNPCRHQMSSDDVAPTTTDFPDMTQEFIDEITAATTEFPDVSEMLKDIMPGPSSFTNDDLEQVLQTQAIPQLTDFPGLDVLLKENALSGLVDTPEMGAMFKDRLKSGMSDFPDMGHLMKRVMPELSRSFKDEMNEKVWAQSIDGMADLPKRDMERMMRDDVMPGLSVLPEMDLHQMLGDHGKTATGFRGSFGMPDIVVHVMEVYVLPKDHDHEHSPWKIVGLALAMTLALLLALVLIYLIISRCCCKKRKVTDLEQDGNYVDGRPEHRMSLPSELPSLESSEKSVAPPDAFQAEPFRAEAYLAQPYRADPGELAAMQERMLMQLETTNQDWDMGHGNTDKQRLQ